MGLDVTGIGAAITAAKDLVNTFFPNKTEEEKAQMAAMLQMIQNQTDINKAEAMSSDPLQHWRGGLGWVCTMGYAWNFVIEPLTTMIAAWAGHPLNLAPLDISELTTLTLGMLGLGGLHVVERVKGAS